LADSLDTVRLHGWLDRMRAGDAAAREQLLRASCGRLERLARKMLRRFPGVARWEESGDVLQNAVLRLLRALRDVRPESVGAFFGLAAEQIQRELLDLAKHYYGPCGQGANHASQAPRDPAESGDALSELELWSRFHEAVEQLPAEEREVIGLAFYHGWTRARMAELFQVDERTIRRRWQSACLRLNRLVGGFPSD